MKSHRIQLSNNLELNHLIGNSVNNALLRRNGELSYISDEDAAQIAGGTLFPKIHGIIIKPNQKKPPHVVIGLIVPSPIIVHGVLPQL